TEAHGDTEAVALVDRFVAATRASVGDTGRLVKSIGDAVLVAFPEPAAALNAICDLFARCLAEEGFPVLRAGAHHGPVVERDGDVFGATVNLAARVAAQAFGGQCLTTQPIADAARSLGLAVNELGEVGLRNVAEPVLLFQVELGFEPAGVVVDPVCRMQVDRRKAAGRLRHGSVDFWFCSLACAAKFASAPDVHSATAGADDA
ncbi:MAG: adenylate/guanylate cyclase domain-containing protein, partial [Acidimicrobiales bacterium]